MKLLHWALALIAVLLLGAPAKAADWLLLLGTESGAPDEPLRPLVFVQPLAQAVLFPDRVSGLTSAKLAPYNGQHAGFNVLSGDDAQSSFSLRRVRLGLKGSVPDTEQAILRYAAHAVRAAGRPVTPRCWAATRSSGSASASIRSRS